MAGVIQSHTVGNSKQYSPAAAGPASVVRAGKLVWTIVSSVRKGLQAAEENDNPDLPLADKVGNVVSKVWFWGGSTKKTNTVDRVPEVVEEGNGQVTTHVPPMWKHDP